MSSPPPIPHGLQLRENCLSCHSGSGAPKDIATTHPERVNCMQCHVANAALDNPPYKSVNSNAPFTDPLFSRGVR